MSLSPTVKNDDPYSLDASDFLKNAFSQNTEGPLTRQPSPYDLDASDYLRQAFAQPQPAVEPTPEPQVPETIQTEPPNVEPVEKPTEYNLAGAAKHSLWQGIKAIGAGIPGAIGRIIPGEDVFERIGKENKAFYDKIIGDDPDIRKYVESVQNESEGFATEVLGNLGPTVAGLGMTFIPYAGPVLATGMFYDLNTDEVEELARQKGADEDTAKRVGVAGGLINTALDMTGIGRMSKVFKPAQKLANFLVGLGITAGIEGGTEGLQGVVSEISSEWAAKPKEETVEQFAERMWERKDDLQNTFLHDASIGAAIGGGAHVVGAVTGEAGKRLVGEPTIPKPTESEPLNPKAIKQEKAIEDIKDVAMKEEAQKLMNIWSQLDGVEVEKPRSGGTAETLAEGIAPTKAKESVTLPGPTPLETLRIKLAGAKGTYIPTPSGGTVEDIASGIAPTGPVKESQVVEPTPTPNMRPTLPVEEQPAPVAPTPDIGEPTVTEELVGLSPPAPTPTPRETGGSPPPVAGPPPTGQGDYGEGVSGVGKEPWEMPFSEYFAQGIERKAADARANHANLIKKALVSGDLTPARYAEIHDTELGYGPLEKFAPEIAKKSDVGEAPAEGTPAVPDAVKAKEPWETTEEGAFLSNEYKRVAKEYSEAKEAFEDIERTYYRSSKTARKRMDRRYSDARRKASELENQWNRLYGAIQNIKEGKPVPQNVLDEYPDLAQKAVGPVDAGKEPAMPMPSQKEKTKQTSIGKAWVDNQWRPITESKQIARGKNKGKWNVTLPNGRHKIVETVRMAETPDVGKEAAPSKEAKAEPQITENKTEVKVSVPIPEKQADNLTLKEQKSYLIAEVDKAIEIAPDYEAVDFKLSRNYDQEIKDLEHEYAGTTPEERFALDAKINAISLEGRAEWSTKLAESGKSVVFEVPGDGTFRVINSKQHLQEFKKNISKAFKAEPTTQRKPSDKLPTSTSNKKESIGLLVPLKQKGWFSDGHVAVKGKPPAGAKFQEGKGQGADLDVVIPKNKPPKATLSYFAMSHRDTGNAISKKPLPAIEGKGDSPYLFVVFEADGKKGAFNQLTFNVIRNRYPNATYRMRNDDMLLAYDKGDLVGILMGVRTTIDNLESYYDQVKAEGDIRFQSFTPPPNAKLGVSNKALERLTDIARRGWANAPKFVVVDSQEKLPPRYNREGKVISGAYVAEEDTVYLVSGNMPNIKFAVRSIFHEAWGHKGFDLIRESKQADSFNRFLDRLYATKKADIDKVAEGYGFNVSEPGGRNKAIDEWLARQAEQNPNDRWVSRAISYVKDWIARVFPNLKVSNAEVRRWLVDMRKGVIEGESDIGKVGTNEFAQPTRFSLKEAANKIKGMAAFKKWFRNGVEPNVLFHGTAESFDVFDRTKSPTDDIGFHLGSRQSAEARLENTAGRRRATRNDLSKAIPEDYRGMNLMPVYTNIQNPLRLPDCGTWSATSIATAMEIKRKEIHNLTKDQKDYIKKIGYSTERNKTQKLREYIESIGFDGIVYSNQIEKGGDSYIAFHPTQIKSIYNQGTWDATNPDIRLQLAGEQAPTETSDIGEPRYSIRDISGVESLTPETPKDKLKSIVSAKFDDFMYWVVDKNRPIASVQKQLSNIRDDIDVFLKETQRSKRTSARLEKAWDEDITPLINGMAREKVNIPDFEMYLQAMHTPEANESLRRSNAKRMVEQIRAVFQGVDKAKVKDINKIIGDAKKPDEWYSALSNIMTKYRNDPDAEGVIKNIEKFYEKPSGMTDEESAKVLEQYKGDRAKLDNLRKYVDEINRKALDLAYDAGQLEDEVYEKVKNKFKYYVPLQREGFSDTLYGPSRGLNPSARLVKIRGGSTRPVVNILANTIANYERAINVSEKARSQRALYGLVQENPDNGLLTIEEVPKNPRYDSYGNIRMYPNTMNVADDQMRLMVDGKQYMLTANRDNPNAMRLIRTLKAEDDTSGPIVNALSKVNRFLARVNTSWAPEFIISNFVRDLQTAGINIKDTEVKGKGMLSGAAKAVKAIFAVERGKQKGTELEKYYDRFKEAGGKIGWPDIHGSVQNMTKNLTKELEMRSGQRPTRKAFTDFFRFIDDANTSIENGIRLHVFKLAVEQGKTDEQAARIASDLTVDFTKKGAAGPVINSLYLFANAGIQGSYRILRAATKSKAVQRHMAYIASAGFLVGMFNALMGGEDDAEDKYINKLDDSILERNAVFMLPGTGGKYVKIPLPWGYNFIWNLGTEMARAFTEQDYNPWSGGARTAKTFANAFNPISGGTLLQTLAPTVLDPIAQVAENKNWFGGPLMPFENKFAKTPTPDSQRYWSTTGVVSKWVAEQLNELTGGNKVKPGFIDVSPETLNLIIDTMGGSAMRFAKDTFNMPIKAIQDEKVAWYKIPFWRRIAGEQSEWANSRTYYNNVENVNTVAEMLKVYKGTDEYQDIYDATQAERSLIPFAKNIENRLKKLRKSMRNAQAKGNKEFVNRLEERVDDLYVRFNERYYQAIRRFGKS